MHKQRQTMSIVTIFGTLYVFQGFITSLVQFVMPTILRDKGVTLSMIGLSYLLFSPLVLKPLWAPWVDRAVRHQARRRLNSILICQLLMIASFMLFVWVNPERMSVPVLCFLVVALMFVVASQDISTDALSLEVVPLSQRRYIGSTQVGGAYLGYFLGASGWIALYAFSGWRSSMMLTTGLFIVLSLLVAMVGRRYIRQYQPAGSVSHSGASLRHALTSRKLMLGVLFLVVYQIGGRLGVSLFGPMMIDAKISLVTLSQVMGVGTAISGIAGALIATWFIRRWGSKTTLWVFALLHGGAMLAVGFLALGVFDHYARWLIGLFLFETLLFACAYGALFVQMMTWCSQTQAGTDFSVLQSADSALAIGAGLGAGVLAHYIGYGVVFMIASGLLVLAAAYAYFYQSTAERVIAHNSDG